MSEEEPKKKRPYVSPKIYRIKLNHEQAVLSACHTSAVTVRKGVPNFCKSMCRASQMGGGQANSGASS